jgi:hypothetical protein
MDIKILVATHKNYKMPADGVYAPIHVGRAGKKDLGYLGDNTGDNISAKNPSFCELTGLYWAWKNLDCDYIGLCHYRRHFSLKSGRSLFAKEKIDYVLKREEISALLDEYDVVLPTKRNYYIETIHSHYKHAHNIRDLELTRSIIETLYPAYIPSYERVMSGRKLYLFNMFIMKKLQFDAYAQWLFDILFQLEKEIDISSYDDYQKRVLGFISERLFNVWIENQNLKSCHIPVINLERVNWINKIYKFVLRKISVPKNRERDQSITY